MMRGLPLWRKAARFLEASWAWQLGNLRAPNAFGRPIRALDARMETPEKSRLWLTVNMGICRF